MLYIRLPLQLEVNIQYLSTQKPLKVGLKEYKGKYMTMTPNTP